MKNGIGFLFNASLIIICAGCSNSGIGFAENSESTDMNNDNTKNVLNNFYEISCDIVEPTCISEGYTEHTFNNGYVFRDNFEAKIPHNYIEFEIKGDNSIVYSVCSFCGVLKNWEQTDINIDTDVVIDKNREKPSFVNHDYMAVSMVLEHTPESAIIKIRSSEMHGAHGIMIYLNALEEQYRNINDLERIMYCTNLPILVIANGSTDLLRLGVKAGACAVDMPGYLFDDYNDIPRKNKEFKDYYISQGIDVSFVDSNAKEISLDPDVVEKQRLFIDEMHELGAEVLYSAHTRVEMNSSQIVSAASFMEILGVDVAKIVCDGSSKESVIEHLKAVNDLENELKIKFSVHGESTLSRLLCPMFGSYIAYCVDDKIANGSTNLQIDLETMIAIIEYLEISKNFQ